MARYCPVKDGPALYLDCRECEEKECEKADGYDPRLRFSEHTMFSEEHAPKQTREIL